MSLLQFTSLAAIMAAAWLIQRSTGLTGWIDVCWTFGVGAVAAIGSLIPLSHPQYFTARQILVAVLLPSGHSVSAATS